MAAKSSSSPALTSEMVRPFGDRWQTARSASIEATLEPALNPVETGREKREQNDRDRPLHQAGGKVRGPTRREESRQDDDR